LKLNKDITKTEFVKMKVLYITHCTGMAGANRSMYQMIMELRESYGVEPYVLLPYENLPQRNLKDYLTESNIEYKECNIVYFKRESYTTETRLNYVYYLREIESLAESLKPMGFDLVHSNSSVMDFGGYISRVLGVKHIWHLRDFGELDYNLHSIWGELYKRATYRNGDVFIAISDIIKKYFSRCIPEDKIHTIYNGIKQTDNVLLANHENEKVQFICAGVICEAKNQKEIVKAVDILVNEKNIQKLHLTIVGPGGGDYLESMKRFAKDRNINDYITFLGEVDGIAQLASTMDVGIMSSHCEAFGRTTVEYMLQNLAVIANDSGANTEIITDGETGLIYEHDSELALADKMQELIENRKLLIHLAEKGRKEALNRFLSRDNTRQVFELYQKTVSERKRNKPEILLNPKLIMNVLHYKDAILQKILRK